MLETRPARSAGRPWLFLFALAGGLLPGVGCANEDEGPSAAAQCVSTRDYFANTAWPQVFAKHCLKCHTPDGLAGDEGAALSLHSPAYPGFLDHNLENVRTVSSIEQDGLSELLRKPVGEMEHGGETVINRDSPEYAVLEELVRRLSLSGDDCNVGVSAPTFSEVTLLDPPATLRKASLALAGRLPTAAELEAVTSGGEGALGPAVDALMTEDAFFERLKEIYNDVFLTDRYLGYTGYAVNLLYDADFPQSGAWFDAQTDELRAQINLGLAREPLELIAHVVRNGRSFKEVLTAPYMVVNPYSAQVLGVTPTFADPTDENEFVEVQITTARGAVWPHSGLLTSPMWLNRFPTTPTNRNRHRARMVMQHFLATDILKVAERPVDPLASTDYQNPTRDDPGCASCHRQLDPIAGAFQKWNEYDPERYEPDQEWHSEMFPPGFGEEVMQTSDYGEAQRWLAERVVSDQRFLLSAVRTVYQGLTGQTPLAYPSDVEHPDHLARLQAWEDQDAFFRLVSEAFVESEYDLRVVFRQVVLSPYFRAANVSGTVSTARAVELQAVGTERFLGPEALARKVRATTGYDWVRDWDRASWLLTDYRILFGGIDSDTVNTRLSEPNGVMWNVVRRMANEVACGATAWDFTKPQGERTLFPHVTVLQVPATPAGDPVPAAVDAIKLNLQHLHSRLLGEELAVDSPELERTYQLFVETWQEGSAAVAAGTLGDGLEWGCRGRWDRNTGVELPDAERVEQDPDYAIRSWMAVITYLLSDYRFIHE